MPQLDAHDEDGDDRCPDGISRTDARLVPGLNMPIRDLFNLDPHLWVYDKTTGEMLAEMALPANATGAPMTYMAGGKQFIVFPVGGAKLVEELIAVSL